MDPERAGRTVGHGCAYLLSFFVVAAVVYVGVWLVTWGAEWVVDLFSGP